MVDLDFKALIKEFRDINKKGYIQGVNNYTNAGGLTFEKLLNKQIDSMFFPDYKGIEIKSTTRFSRYDINLFSVSFDGPQLFESNYLLQKYGKIDSKYKEYKKLVVNFKLNKKNLVNGKYYFELKLDYADEKLYINIYDIQNNLLEQAGFLYFTTLEKRIKIKLSRLALVFASKKRIENNLFFRYYKIICYQYKDFATFLKLLENGDIAVSTMLRFSRNINTLGKNRNKSFCFSIKKERIGSLFEEVYSWEN